MGQLGRTWINRIPSWQKCDNLVCNTNCHLNPFEAKLGGISKKDHGVVLFLYLKVTKLMVGCDDHILIRNMSPNKQKMVLAPQAVMRRIFLTPHLHPLF